MDWQQYEDEIYTHFRDTFPAFSVTKNVRLVGRYSKVERQIDILIEGRIADFQMRIAVDAKHRGRPIDVADVEGFVGFCSDIGAQKGVLIALNGYTAAAINRAYFDDHDIELDVLNFADLELFQGRCAIPYSGSHGVVLSAPFGWIIDGTGRPNMMATLYQRGKSFEQATASLEWAYVNIVPKDSYTSSLDALLALQDGGLRADFPISKLTYLDGPKRDRWNTKIRCFEEASYPTPEYTGFVDFKDCIFLCVLYSPKEVANRNLRKLDEVLRTVRNLSVRKGSK